MNMGLLLTRRNRKAIIMGSFNGKRPAHVQPPAHLSKSPPVPQPDPIDAPARHAEEMSPVRYGDWERKGIAIDF